jgi:hypothetical protein
VGPDVISKAITVEPEPQPMKFDKYQSEFTFTYAYYSIVDYATIDFNWHHGNGDLDDYGSAPPDNARISFGDDYKRDYYYDNWVYYGDNSGDPPVRSKYKDHGAVAEFRDGDDNDGEGHFGVRVDPQQGDKYSRDIYFRYVHTWEEIELDTSLSTQPPFLLMNLSGSGKKWDVERSYQEADLDDGGETYSP